MAEVGLRGGVPRVGLFACVCVLGVLGWLVAGCGLALSFETHAYLSRLSGFGSSTAIAFDAAGDVYVVDTEAKTVDRFNAAGSPLAFSASESYVLGSKLTGTPGGAFGEPDGVAVNRETGVVYVADGVKHVVDVFNATGEYVMQLTEPGPAATVKGPFNDPKGLTVDEVTHDVYVTDTGGGERASVVDVFDATGAYVSQFGEGVLGASVGVNDLTGDAYVGYSGSDTVAVFDMLGALLPPEWTGAGTPNGSFGVGFVQVGLDPGSHHVYVTGLTGFGETGAVSEFEASGSEEYVGGLSGTPTGPSGSFVPFASPQGVAVSPVSGDVYVSDAVNGGAEGVVDVFGPDTVLPDVSTTPASEVEPLSAMLNGSVNPLEAGLASCQFVWGTSEAFGQSAPCVPATMEGGSPVPVHLALSGLEPDTTYFFRVQASNANGLNPGEPRQDQSFTTPGPGLHGESVSEVSGTSATFQASINPHGAATSYYFQYGKSSEYEATVPAAPGISIGAGEGDVKADPLHVQGLSLSSTYHYRVVAISELEVEGVLKQVVFPGVDKTFTTQGSGAGTLLDGRQWELVSPADKHGAQLQPIAEGHVTQAAENGDAFTFLTNAPTEDEPAGYAAGVQVLSARGSSGWESQDLASAHDQPTGTAAGGQEYRVFSEDLSLAAVQPLGVFTPSVSPEASEQTSYLRTALSHGAFCTGSCYQPFVTGCPEAGEPCSAPVAEHANVEPGTIIDNEERCHLVLSPIIECGPKVVGASADMSHVVLASGAALTPGANTGGALYEWSAKAAPGEQLQLVSLLPEGKGPATNLPALGYQNEIGRHAVSDDGSRVIWSTGFAANRHLYLRDMLLGETVQLDAPQPGSSGVGATEPAFVGASDDGSRVFFTDPQRLTESAGSHELKGKFEGDLYECLIVVQAGKPRCELSDLTPAEASGETAQVLDLPPGVSEDGQWVYFVADGVLAPGAKKGTCKPQAEESPPGAMCNLYVWHDGVTKLVAAISSEDNPDWNGRRGEFYLARVTSRVSPDGRWVEFMSQRSLTGYDSSDAVTSHADEEVFLYHAEVSGGGVLEGGKVLCASCDPTAGRPVGVEYGEMAMSGLDGFNVWPVAQGLGGSVPAWTGYGGGSALYQSRYLSDSGRVFFNSAGALVPGDTNGVGDVYEFEPVGVGGCSSGSGSGSVVFVAHEDGCVGLVSSGRSDEESGFLDASESGGDVFFLTAAKLSTQDFDTSLDVYDAHECTGDSPCFPAPVVSPPACDNESSCKPSPSAQPEIFGSPSSATFTGAGNQPPAVKPKPKPLTAAQVRAQQLARALKACRAKHSRVRRLACQRQAHRRYGSRAAKAKHASNGRGGK
jgi:DNA-binding beta-propeller fold protein YncE